MCVCVCVGVYVPTLNFAGFFEDSDRLYPRRPGTTGGPGIVFDTPHLLPSLMCSTPCWERGGRLLKCKYEAGGRGQVKCTREKNMIDVPSVDWSWLLLSGLCKKVCATLLAVLLCTCMCVGVCVAGFTIWNSIKGDEREMRLKNYGSGRELKAGGGKVKRSHRKESKRREWRSEGERENDYFIIKPSVMWAAATTQTLLRSSLCGSVGVCLCAYPLVLAFASCCVFVLTQGVIFCASIFPRVSTAKRQTDVWCMSFMQPHTGRILSEGQTLSFNGSAAMHVLACFFYILIYHWRHVFQSSVQFSWGSNIVLRG